MAYCYSCGAERFDGGHRMLSTPFSQGSMQPGPSRTLMPADSLPIAPGAEDALSQMTRAAPLLQVCAHHCTRDCSSCSATPGRHAVCFYQVCLALPADFSIVLSASRVRRTCAVLTVRVQHSYSFLPALRAPKLLTWFPASSLWCVCGCYMLSECTSSRASSYMRRHMKTCVKVR